MCETRFEKVFLTKERIKYTGGSDCENFFLE